METSISKIPMADKPKTDLDGNRPSYIFSNRCDDPLSVIRQRNDLVGKRILCIPEGFNINTPSPAAVTSSIWKPNLMQLVQTSSISQQKDSKLIRWPKWCPKHHHHQPNQVVLMKALETLEQDKLQKGAGLSVGKQDTNNRHRVKVSKIGAGQQKFTQPDCDKNSYSVLKSKKLTTSSTDKAQIGSTNSLLQQSDSIPTEEDVISDSTCELCKLHNDKFANDYVSTDANVDKHLDSKYRDQYEAKNNRNLFDGLKSACVSSSDRKLHLSSLPWRIGTIRAISHHDTKHQSSSWMIEFDLLDWHTREWYPVCDTTGNSKIWRDQSEDNPAQTNHSTFSVLLIENAACCLKRRLAPTGRDKLWPALMFEPLIDKLGLFNASTGGVCNLRAIEYLEPAHLYGDCNTMQPICDISTVVKELETEFSDASSAIKRICLHKSTSSVASDRLQNISYSETFNLSDNNLRKQNLADETRIENECNCWSPRVEFVEDSLVYKMCRKDVDVDELLSGRNNSFTIMSETEHQELETNFSDVKKEESTNHKRQKLEDQGDLMKSLGGLIINVDKSHMSSFRRFLRFFHHVYTQELSRSDKLGGIVESTSDNPDDLRVKSEVCSGVLPATDSCHSYGNDLLEAIIRYPSLYHTIQNWHFHQDAQSLLGNTYTAALLVGHRVKVYRCSGTTQWFTAVIISYDARTTLLTLIDDTVLEEHHEDATLLEMDLIDKERLVKSIIEGDDEFNKTCTIRRRVPRTSNQRRLTNQATGNSIMNSSTTATANGVGQANSSNSSSNSGGGGNTNLCINTTQSALTRTAAYLTNPVNTSATPTIFSNTLTSSPVMNRPGKPHNKSLSVGAAASVAAPVPMSLSQSGCLRSFANSSFSTVTGNQTQTHHNHHHHHQQQQHQQQQHQQQQLPSQRHQQYPSRPLETSRCKSKGNINPESSTYLIEAYDSPFKRRHIASRRVSSDYFWRPKRAEDKFSLDEYESFKSHPNKYPLETPFNNNNSSLVNYDSSSSGLLMKVGRLRGTKKDGKNFLLHRLRLEALGEQLQQQHQREALAEQASRKGQTHLETESGLVIGGTLGRNGVDERVSNSVEGGLQLTTNPKVDVLPEIAQETVSSEPSAAMAVGGSSLSLVQRQTVATSLQNPTSLLQPHAIGKTPK